jgi:hypothetical protein
MDCSCNTSFLACQTFQNNFILGLATGIAVGTFVPLIINPLEKVNTQVMVGRSRENFFKSVVTEPFKGANWSMANSMMKTIFLFSSIPLYQRITDQIIPQHDVAKFTSYILSAITMNYALSPLQVIKARLYTQKEKNVSEIWKSLPPSKRVKLLFAGSSTSAIKTPVYWSIFLTLSDTINDRLQKLGLISFAPLISGGLGVCGAHIVSYPFDVISKAQKVGNLPPNFFQAVKTFFQNEGGRAFFRGILQANVTRIFIAGPMTEMIIVKVNQFFDDSCKH